MPPVPDSLHLQFARGWLALGDVAEAELELGRIRKEYRGCSDVLEMRFQVLSRLGRHPEALKVAERQVKSYPEEFRGHMNRGNALFWLDRAQDACEAVEAVMGDYGADVVKTGMLPTPEVWCDVVGGEEKLRAWGSGGWVLLLDGAGCCWMLLRLGCSWVGCLLLRSVWRA